MKKLITTLAVLSFTTLLASSALAVVPPLIPVQGILTDSGGHVIDGNRDLRFAIYDSLGAVSHLWTEIQTDVPVDEGFFSVYLGDDTPLPVDVLVGAEELWLSMTVSGEELSRVQLAAVPYALEAQVCRQLGALEEDDVQPVLSGDNACPDGNFLRGWDADAGAPLCVPDPVPYAHDHDDVYYTETEVDSALGGKADSVHIHDDLYYTETEVDSALAGKADSVHAHDDVYYTETEMDSALGGKADSVHAHDDLYYTETEMDSALSGKADEVHGHSSLVGDLDVTGKISATGAVQVGDDGSTCDATAAGSVRWNGATLQACDGTDWKTVRSIDSRPVLMQSESAYTIAEARTAAGSELPGRTGGGTICEIGYHVCTYIEAITLKYSRLPIDVTNGQYLRTAGNSSNLEYAGLDHAHNSLFGYPATGAWRDVGLACGADAGPMLYFYGFGSVQDGLEFEGGCYGDDTRYWACCLNRY